jgi:hypothetical protein
MRILAAHPGPHFSVHDVYTGWVEALCELGQHVIEFNLSERLTFYESTLIEANGETHKALSVDQAQELAVNGLYAALYKARPHVLFVVSAFFIPAALLDLARSYGTRVVVLHTESPYEDGRQLSMAEHASLNLINDPTNLERFRALAPTRYVPHSYRPSVHCPGSSVPELGADLAFVGTGYQSRIDFFEAMDLGELDVLLAGNWQTLANDSPLRRHVAHEPDACLDNAQTIDVYRSAKVGINLYRREADTDELATGIAMGPREIEMAACGLFFLRESRPEGDTVLDALPTFESPAEASAALRFWLARPAQRESMAKEAREAIADYTFTSRAAELLRWLTKEN